MKKKKSKYFIEPKLAPTINQFKGLNTTILTGFTGEKMMMVLNYTMPRTTVSTHSHPHEQIGIVYSGKAKMWVGDEKKIVKKGDFYCIPGNVPHGDTCIGNKPFVMLDIFYPVRETFIEKLKNKGKK